MNGRAEIDSRVLLPEQSKPLSNIQFRWLCVSNVGFFLALYGETAARSWLAFELTNSKFALGQVAAAAALPMVIGAPLGGVIADRIERRKLIMVGQFAALLGTAVILILLWSRALRFWHLTCCTGLIGFAFPMIIPARQAIVANLVGRSGLTRAIAITTGLMHASRVLGPLLFGGLIAASGVRTAYVVGEISYGCAISALFGVAPLQSVKSAPRSVLEDFWDGVRFILANRLLSNLLLLGLVPMFLVTPLQQLLVVFAEEVFHVGSGGFGLLQGAAGLGGVLGAVLVARRQRTHRMQIMALTALGCALLVALVALVPWFWPAVLLVFLAFACCGSFTMLNNAAILMLVPDSVRGRVSSFMLLTAALPLAVTLPVGALADIYGARTTILGASVLCGISMLLVICVSRSLRTLDAVLTAPNAEGVARASAGTKGAAA